MARFSMNTDLNQFSSSNQNRTNYFSLRNDGDMARVRFMYNDIDDIAVDVLHQVKVNGKDRWANCLREYNSPVDDCPLCKAGVPVRQKVYFYLYDEDEGVVKVWDKSAAFAKSIIPTLSRAVRDGSPLCSTIFEIERHGEANSRDTTYGVYPSGKDDKTLNDLPETPNLLGGLILDKNASEMNTYLQTGSFPQPDNGDEVVSRRDARPTSNSQTVQPQRDDIEIPRRRTPFNNGTDRF